MTDYVDVTATATTAIASTNVQSYNEIQNKAPSITEAARPSESKPEPNTEAEQAKVMEGRRLKRKQSLEAQVTTGCGGGRKKQRIVDAFYGTLWPMLEESGWKMIKGEGEEEGAVYFLPPEVAMVDKDQAKSGDKASTESSEEIFQDDSAAEKETEAVLDVNSESEWKCTKCGHLNSEERTRCKVCMGWKGGSRLPKAYFNKVRDVLERVLKSSDEAETKAADAYKKLVPGIYDQLFCKRATPPQGRRMGTRQKQAVEVDWKHERRHYPKASSRVGEDYQVTDMPIVCKTFRTDCQSDQYDQIWDWEEAMKSGKVEFVNNRVTANKKVEAHEKLYQRGFVIPGFYQEVCAIPATNGSDWTEDDKKRFKTSIFKELKNIRRVSKVIGKPMNECMTYYYGTFKKSKDYPRLKLAIYRHKQKLVSGGSGDTWICDTCGVGGTLIACDSCELHYHLTCLIPPLQEIPEGTWICNRCSTKANVHASESCSKKDSNGSYHIDGMDADLLTAAGGAPTVCNETGLKVPSNTEQGAEHLANINPGEVEMIAQERPGLNVSINTDRVNVCFTCNSEVSNEPIAPSDANNKATNQDLDMPRGVTNPTVPDETGERSICLDGQSEWEKVQHKDQSYMRRLSGGNDVDSDMTSEGNICLDDQSEWEEVQLRAKSDMKSLSCKNDVDSGGDGCLANEGANLDASASSKMEGAKQNVEGSNSPFSQDGLNSFHPSTESDTDFIQQKAVEASTVQSSDSIHAIRDSMSSAALEKLKEIFKAEHHSNDASKFPTLSELSGLRSSYSLTTKQINDQFKRMRNAENASKKKAQKAIGKNYIPFKGNNAEKDSDLLGGTAK